MTADSNTISPIPIHADDSVWTIAASIAGILTGLATVGLVITALYALVTALRQLDAIRDERTIRLVQEASSEGMEKFLGFFDYAAKIQVSRAAFSRFYERVIQARIESVSNQDVDDIDQAARATLSAIESEIDAEIVQPAHAVNDRLREEHLRARIIQVANYFETVWTLIDANLANRSVFFRDQDYNVVATYYVLEPILNDLAHYESFDFEDFRRLARMAQPYLRRWLEADHPLRTALFEMLPDKGPFLRDTKTESSTSPVKEGAEAPKSSSD